MKIVYRILVFVFVFCGSVAFFSGDISERTVQKEETVEMASADLPLVFMKVNEESVNTLYGYRINLDANSLRDSITLMNQDKLLHVLIDEKESSVRKLAYELRGIDEDELLDSGSVLALEQEEDTGRKVTDLKIQADLVSGKEYALKLMLVTKDSRKIYYYTRVKYYESDTFFQEKLDFVMDFHKKAWNKDKKNELQSYLETNSTMDNKSLALVNIHSSHALICWGDLKPELIGEIVPVLKEINIETAAFELSYRVSAKTASGEETFSVKEFFRVKYANGNRYLLYYQRTMEADFDIELTSLSKNELKLGITSDENMSFVTSSNGSRTAFVRNRELWYYNIAENAAVKVFSFRGEDSEDVRELYDQHNIRILNMDDDGMIDFLVYGYMNRGSYEGKTAMILYRFYPEQARVEERVYIPFELPYERMKYDLDEFSYVSGHDVYYFSIQNTVYAYNIPAKRLEILAEGISSDNIYLCTEGSYIAWQNSSKPQKATKITILDLETEARKKIRVKKKNRLTLLGGINDKLIYGIMRKGDIAEADDGTIVTPMYQVKIVDTEGNTVKKYNAGKYYVTGVEIEDSIITLNRSVRHEQNGKLYYTSYTADHIINNQEEKKVYVSLTKRTTDLTLTEYYVNLTQGYVLQELPSVTQADFIVLNQDTTLRLEDSVLAAEKYYVYALGDVIDACSSVADAINRADEQMGVVVSNDGQMIWERGAKYNHNSVEGISIVRKSASVSSRGACLSMLLAASGDDVAAEKLSDSSKSMFTLFKKYSSKMPLKLTGCSLDAVLYYVSSSRPVIAMKSSTEAVLITGYDEYSVTVIDPAYGKSVKYSMEKAEKMFGEADDVFISYH
jgi:hypothetical protein